jgi:hypothetical protein
VVVTITFRLPDVILLQPLIPPSSFSEHQYEKRYKPIPNRLALHIDLPDEKTSKDLWRMGAHRSKLLLVKSLTSFGPHGRLSKLFLKKYSLFPTGWASGSVVRKLQTHTRLPRIGKQSATGSRRCSI